MTTEHWRFNSSIPWHYFSSAVYESVLARESTNQFQKYHHLRSCTYFSVCCFEAFLNAMMREKLGQDGLAEGNILKKLRFGKLAEKLQQWPSEVSGKQIEIPSHLLDVFNTFQSLRNEVTHAKTRDHSVYVELDRLRPDQIIDALARVMVMVYEAKGCAFPYWLLGWNFVGVGGDPGHPLESTNLNGFVHSLRSLGIGFNNYGSDFAWEKKAMTSIKGYEELKRILSQVQVDIEPKSDRFPFKPRLTRRWWDVEVVR
ncbi:hypothetical protein SB783_38680 [Paraburkholderia sp. SIMBA_009]|uniref:RiboL-PSP-HEPN domain-containing protein n=1 Tax=Paraburkholderia tropica TaxID=92647 RepID=A0ABX5MCT3_9BURK|nr:hypothetical protein [Paraburkholderia tropica]PXX02222.1 hypothetical protein C7400_1603 [Paraburkholderia tropica]PZW68346.1 hypothetical protein C7399_1613 [Paraburkholderia tropica]QNB17274.1 hypothetical protein G5S35_37220 [Paraburkholderia tropica]